MSKVDANRAMREAKYARGGKPPDPPGSVPSKAPARPRPASPKTGATKTGATASPVAAEETTDERCGHRNMGGKSCSRPMGHSEKNHRYAAA